jgi:crotonobetainyl-CoA:carnitine CoA-transferase CaiB-like acyl-CoA transferase
LPGDEEIYRVLEENRVPYAPVLSVEQAMRTPHLREREIVRTVSDRFLGELELPGFPLRFSEFPHHLELEAPILGEHNEEILREDAWTGAGTHTAVGRDGRRLSWIALTSNEWIIRMKPIGERRRSRR